MPKDTNSHEQGSVIKKRITDEDVVESALSWFMRLNGGRTPKEIASVEMPAVVASSA